MAPHINGPWRKWSHRQKPLNGNDGRRFENGSDIVWWTQSDPPEQEPGGGINEDASEWWYTPKQAWDPELVVQYYTHHNQRHGQFIFPAFFLNQGQYQICCKIVSKNGASAPYEDSWDVTVRKP